MRILTVDQLCKTFGGLKAINNLDFFVDEGEIVGIIGPNGSGKTTALNLITGFLKPNTGKITFQGMDITGLPRYQINKKGIADIPALQAFPGFYRLAECDGRQGIWSETMREHERCCL
jgi:ABC-type branched-subunit amino acid transport system ATPase component